MIEVCDTISFEYRYLMQRMKYKLLYQIGIIDKQWNDFTVPKNTIKTQYNFDSILINKSKSLDKTQKLKNTEA